MSVTLAKLTSGLHQSPVKAGVVAAAGARGDGRAPWAAQVPEEWQGETEALVRFRGGRLGNGVSLLLPRELAGQRHGGRCWGAASARATAAEP